MKMSSMDENSNNMRNKSILRLLLVLLISVSFSYWDRAQAVPGWEKVEQDPYTVLLEDKYFGSCTGTKISNSGHILTARHCFNQSLISKGYASGRPILEDLWVRSPYSPRPPELAMGDNLRDE